MHKGCLGLRGPVEGVHRGYRQSILLGLRVSRGCGQGILSVPGVSKHIEKGNLVNLAQASAQATQLWWAWVAPLVLTCFKTSCFKTS